MSNTFPNRPDMRGEYRTPDGKYLVRRYNGAWHAIQAVPHTGFIGGEYPTRAAAFAAVYDHQNGGKA